MHQLFIGRNTYHPWKFHFFRQIRRLRTKLFDTLRHIVINIKLTHPRRHTFAQLLVYRRKHPPAFTHIRELLWRFRARD